MDDFSGLLTGDFGLKPQGKSAPMASSRDTPAASFNSFSTSSGFRSSSTRNKSGSTPIFDDHDASAGDDLLFNDVFGGPPKYASADSRSKSAFDYDTLSKDHNVSKPASAPVYDKPVFDEDIFEGIPGLKSSMPSGSANYEDVFTSISSSPPKAKKQENSAFDDLLGNFGKKETKLKGMEGRKEEKKNVFIFDDLIPGFGANNFSSINRSASDGNQPHKSSSEASKASHLREDPFVLFESSSTPTVSSADVFTDPLDEISKLNGPGSRKADRSPSVDGVFDDIDILNSFGKSQPERDNRWEDTHEMRTESMNSVQSPTGSSQSMNKAHLDDILESHHTSFEMPRAASPPYVKAPPSDVNVKIDQNSVSDENLDSLDDIWLTVSEVPLSTRPTSAPPPSRPPPPKPTKPVGKRANQFPSFSDSSQHNYSPSSGHAYSRSSVASQIDELEDFAMGKAQGSANGYPGAFPGEEINADHVAAAMKEAMDKAEAKFKQAREVRERENMKAGRNREGFQPEKDAYLEKERRERQERLEREQKQREREEEENERRLEKERERAHELEREMQEKEKERKRLERERLERERELARQAVERATREARERAAAEARAKAQKAAVEKASAEARERAERAAVQRAQAEARERAAAEARERAAKAAAEAREREAARIRSERAAAERAATEARERAAAEAREKEVRVRAERAAAERAAAEARERAAAQVRASQRNDNDLESFFSMGARPNSAPKSRANYSEPLFETQKKPPEAARSSTGATSNIRKASSTANIVDDLSSIFGAAASSSGEFQEFEGESEERRRARLERHQRTQERAAKALAEKNERDLQAQRDQAERYRIAETLDVEIRRWAAGKEGNLRALLSTLQYVLWPECGWQPVSLTDLITAASVKKVYRKATLCIHPDKVQQKGATLQQKYVAEKVFDLLKEAWNKFNSEELF